MSEPTYGEQMREAMKGLLAPVAEKHAELVMKEGELVAELESIREAKREALSVLRRIDPETYGDRPGPKKGNGRSKANAQGPEGWRTFPNADKDATYVREWIEANPGKVPDEFSANQLVEAMRVAGDTTLGKDKIRHSAVLLHERGAFTLRRTKPGGGRVYALTGGGGPS